MYSTIKTAVNRIGRIVNLGFYEGVKASFGLAPSVTSTRPTDKELHPWDREAMISNNAQIQSNFAFAAFLVDKHIQYMSTFKFQCKSPYAEFNKHFELLFSDWKRKKNCDLAEQFSFDEMLLMIERHRVCDGDVMILKTRGGKRQIIEGDRIRNAKVEKDPPNQWVHGIKCDRNGKVLQYHIATRLPDGGFDDERHIWAENAWLVGYRRNSNQRRGVSPMAPAINHLRILNKIFNHAAAKDLLASELAIVLNREPHDNRMFPTLEDQAAETERFNNNLSQSMEGIKVVSMGINEAMKMVGSEYPSLNQQLLWKTLIRLVLLSLKIPYTFYDGSETTYFGAEGEYNQYFDSCATDQIPMIDWLCELTEWLLSIWVSEELIEIPDGETLESMARYFMWSNGGMPYFLLFRLIKDALPAIMIGATTPQKFAAMFGSDFADNARDILKAIQDTDGIPFSFKFQANTSISS